MTDAGAEGTCLLKSCTFSSPAAETGPPGTIPEVAVSVGDED